jgi:hypothetical protein
VLNLTQKMILQNIRTFNIVSIAFMLITAFSCQGDKKEEIEIYREKVVSQKVMLDDAIKQLELEKKQVKILQEQIALKEQQAAIKVVAKPNKDDEAVQANYAKMKSDINEWKSLLASQEKEYSKVKKDLDVVLNYLGENKIAIVRNKIGEIEKLTAESRSTGITSQVSIDSLVTLLETERITSKQTINRLENLILGYQKEVTKWQKRFNENGIFLAEHLSNFSVQLEADSSLTNLAQFKMLLIRQIGQAKKGQINVRISCKLPNGNLFDIYNGTVSYGRKETKIIVAPIKPFNIEVSGSHKVIVYLDNKEAYYEDFIFTKQ